MKLRLISFFLIQINFRIAFHKMHGNFIPQNLMDIFKIIFGSISENLDENQSKIFRIYHQNKYIIVCYFSARTTYPIYT